MKQINQCPRCGGELEKRGENFVCKHCNAVFSDDSAEKAAAAMLARLLDEDKQEKVANLRRRLWQAVTKDDFTDSEKIVEICRNIRNYLPDDFLANFFEVANSGNHKQTNEFLANIDVAEEYQNVEVILDFMLKSIEPVYLLSLNNLIENAYKDRSLDMYEKYTTKLAIEAEKAEKGVYEPSLPRDVFVAYSSKDMAKVEEVVEALERNGISCFVAMRNLKHGIGAVANYEKALETAIDNCRLFLFLSSVHSRTINCEAVSKEMRYVKAQDRKHAPAQYAHNYAQMPSKYKMLRVELLLDQYNGNVVEKTVSEFFSGNEWVYSTESAVERVAYKLLNDAEDEEDEVEQLKRQFAEQQEKWQRTQDEQQATQRKQQEEMQRQFEELLKQNNNRADPAVSDELKRQMADLQRQLQQAAVSASGGQTDFEIVRGVLVQYKGEETDVVVPAGVREIGDGAFKHYKELRSVTLPAGVKTIARQAFYMCDNLQKAVFPDTLESIGYQAFWACEQLREVVLPASVKEIGEEAFTCCKSLQKVLIAAPDVVFGGNKHVFDNAKEGQTFIFGASNGYFGRYSWLGAGRSKAKVIWHYVPPRKVAEKDARTKDMQIFQGVLEKYTGTDKKVVVPGDVVSAIGQDAFAGTGVTSVELQEGVVTVAYHAFADCPALNSVTIPESVRYMDSNVFAGLKDSAFLVPVGESKANVFCRAPSKPGGWQDKWASGLVPSNVTWGVQAQANGFAVVAGRATYFGDEQDVVVPDSVRMLPSDLGARNSVAIGENVKEIGTGALEKVSYVIAKCSREAWDNVSFTDPEDKKRLPPILFVTAKEEDFKVEKGVLKAFTGGGDVILPASVKKVGAGAFKNSKITSLLIPESVTSFGKGAFAGCKDLSRVFYGGTAETWRKISFADREANPLSLVHTLHSGKVSLYSPSFDGDVADYAFCGCDLKKIRTKSGKIGAFAFCDCKKLTSADISSKKIGQSAFKGCDALTELRFSEKVEEIAEGAFENCTSLAKVFLPKTVETIGQNAFKGCKNLQIYIDAADWKEGWENGCFGTADDQCEVFIDVFGDDDFKIENGVLKAYIGEEKDVVVPYGVREIGAVAFKNGNICSVTLPDTLTFIGEGAFENCNALQTVYYTGNAESWKNIQIRYGGDPTRRGQLTFLLHKEAYGKADDTVGNVQEGAEKETVETPSDPFDIRNGVLRQYKGKAATVVVPDGVTSIAQYAFENCTITDITLPESVTSVGEHAFDNCNGIECATVPTSALAALPKGRLKTVTINGGTKIDRGALQSCVSLVRLTIGSSVTKIENYAFSGCTSLTEINFNATECEDFGGNNSIFTVAGQKSSGIKVTFGDNVRHVPKNLFFPSTDLSCQPKVTSVTIGKNVNSIGAHAFHGCRRLTEINFNATACSDLDENNGVLSSTGGYDEGLTVTFGDNVTRIPAFLFYPFYDCPKLNPVTIGKNVKVIGDSAFCNSTLRSVTIGSGVTDIGDEAFLACKMSVIVIPDSVTTIGESAFEYCHNLVDVTIGSGVKTIGENAFKDCDSLHDINIGKNVTKIGANAFRFCRNATISCEMRKPLFGLPQGFDKNWLGDEKPFPKVVWNAKKK